MPALVRLIVAYIERDARQIVAGGFVERVLGVFQKLISSKQHDHHGLALFAVFFEFLPMYAAH